MKTLNQIDKNTIIYIVNEITRHHGIKNVPPVKLGRLTYLLWLEYASLQPGYEFPKNSPMANMRFINYERGPAEVLCSNNYYEIQSEIISGRVPNFSQTMFAANEKVRLNHAFEKVRNCYSNHRTEDLCYFIQHTLPTCLFKPVIAPLQINNQEFLQEVQSFIKHRHKLK